MKMKVQFSENNMNAVIKLSEANQAIKSDMSEVTVVHDGQNGATFIPSVSLNCVISWTNDRGLPNPVPVNIKGRDGIDGHDGYTPVKGKDYFDGVNGKDGTDGKDGKNGIDGKDGINGKDGYTPIKGIDYFDGADGKDGADGYTPVKGVDYFTEADKAEMVSAVISALPIYNGEVVEE